MTKDWFVLFAFAFSACKATPEGYPTTVAAQERWLQKNFPSMTFDIKGVNPDTFAACLPALEKLRTQWPLPFAALTSIKVTPEDAGWPSSSAHAWYDGKGGIFLRKTRWATSEPNCASTLPHEFGHHIDHWSRGEPGIARFIQENFDLGKSISAYAATSPSEAWAEGFEELSTKAPMQWHRYTQLQSKLLDAWRSKKDGTNALKAPTPGEER